MANIIKTASNSIKNWWIPMLIGALLIALGIYIFTQPEFTFASIAFVFSIAVLFAGVSEIIFSISNRESLTGWGWYLTGGILFLVVGGMLLFNQEVAEEVLPFVFAFMLLFRSIQGLGLSFDLKNNGILDWGNLAIISVLGILFSFLLLIYPLFNAAFLVTLAGLAFIFVGIVGVVIGYYLRRIKKFPQRISKNLRERMEQVQKDFQAEMKDIQKGVKNFTEEVSEGSTKKS